MINHVLVSVQVLATRQDSVAVWGRFGREQGSDTATLELIAVSFAALLLLGAIIWQIVTRRGQRDFAFDSPTRLFVELCRAHQLNRSARRLIKQLAAARGLTSAAELFVEPDYFDMTNVPPNLKSSASEIRQLRHKLFD